MTAPGSLSEKFSAAGQAAALTAEGDAHLAAGAVEKARECYHAAMAMDSKHDSSGPPGLPGYAEIVDEDDWESDLGAKLEALAVSQPTAQGPKSTAETSGASKKSSRTLPRPSQGSQSSAEPIGGAHHRSPLRSCRGPSPAFRTPKAAAEELPYDGRHILEIHSFSSTTSASSVERFVQSLNTHDIEAALRSVDDNTALAIFANPAAASDALLLAEGGHFGVRAYAEAPEKSKQLPLEELQPPAPRPKTSSAVARRLIGMALGEPGLRDKEGEQSLRQQRKMTKDLKAERQRAADAAWDD